MTAVTEDVCVSLVRLAANYSSQSCLGDADSDACHNAAKNASFFGKLLQLVEVFLKSTDDSAVNCLKEYLSSTKFSLKCITQCIETIEAIKQQNAGGSQSYYHPVPSLARLRWRVDITISSSVLSRVLEPSLMMEWVLSNGQKVTFEVPIAKFHKLRYTVASLIKDMDAINLKLNSIKL